jgi:HEAT repeat protein
MIEATRSLPEGMMAEAVHGFRLLGDERAIAALRDVADSMKDGVARGRLQRELDAWRSAASENDRLLTTLRSGTGGDLIKALQGIQEPVAPDVRKAVLSLLDHDDPHVRAEGVVAAAKSHQQSELDEFLRITLALPEAYVPIAARGLELLNDPRAIEPLQHYAVGMKNDSRKREIVAIIDRLRRSSEGMSEHRLKRASLD